MGNNMSPDILKGYRRNAFPGDQVYFSTVEAISTEGIAYPRGTEFCPGGAGADNTIFGGGVRQSVTIGGVSVTFRRSYSGAWK